MFTSAKNIIKKLRLRFGNLNKLNKCTHIALLVSLFLYVFSIPSFSGRPGWNIIPYFCFAILTIVLISRLILFDTLKFNRYIGMIIVFSLYCFFPTIFFSHEFRGCLSVLMLSGTMLVIFASFQSINSKKQVLLILHFALVAFALYFIVYYANKGLFNFTQIGSEKNRLGKYFNNVNWVATFLMVGVITSTILLLTAKRWYEYLNVIPLLVFIYLGLSTGSRTFMLGVLLVLLICFVVRFKNNKIVLIIFFGLFLTFLILILTLPVFAQLRSRFESFIIGGSSYLDVSSAERYQWMKDGLYYGFRNIFIGYGYYGFSYISGVGTYTHSNITELLCDYGLPMTILFYVPIFAILFRHFANKNDEYSKYAIAISVLYIFYSFSTVYYVNKIYYVLIALALFLDEGTESKKKHLISTYNDSMFVLKI